MNQTFLLFPGAANEIVGEVHATDIDEGVNALVSYSIPTHLPFSIDNSTGVITTNTELDYETTKVNNEKKQLSLEFPAEDVKMAFASKLRAFFFGCRENH